MSPATGEIPAAAGRRIALFDLDDTLTARDTLLEWASVLRGAAWAYGAIAAASLLALSRRDQPDYRGRVKAAFLDLIAKGIPEDLAEAAGKVVADRIGWKEDICAAYRRHRANGDRVVIVTASPAVYLPSLLARLGGFDDAIATQLAVADGRLTGKMIGDNNARAAKAARVRSYLDRHGPFAESWGYGNAPHDLPMLELVDHATVVPGG